jgi:hypothetical protein
MGDDHWRFGGANFIPGLGAQNGLYLNHWSPRLTVSGPLKKHRGWFHNSFDAYYAANTIPQLPGGQNRASSLSTTDLTRLQWNLSDRQILTGSFLLNLGDSRRTGLSFLNPAASTTNGRQSLMMATIKDQFLIGGGVLEFGFANSNTFNRSDPQGDQGYIITPFGAAGNFFREDRAHAGRQQWLINGFVRPLDWHGRHQFRNNIEAYSYAVDRWSPVPTLTLEAGLRTQWDEYTGGAPPAPRIAAAWAPKQLGGLKLSAGWGIFYNAITLNMLALSQEQTSISSYYGPDGLPVGNPLQSRFVLSPHDLRLPRFAISSFTAERKLPFGVYGRLNLIAREGSRGFSFEQSILDPSTNLYVLDNIKRESYRAAEFEVRRTFLAKYQWFASFTHSAARSNAVISYSIENPLLTPQTGGPLAWDTPDRVLMWGWAPVEKKWFPRLLQPIVGETDLQLLGDYRTGFPFSAISETGYVVGKPNDLRFPDYFTVNAALERKFPFRGYLWAFRAGLINVLDRSPQFMRFERGQSRAVNVRLRFIGRVK